MMSLGVLCEKPVCRQAGFASFAVKKYLTAEVAEKNRRERNV